MEHNWARLLNVFFLGTLYPTVNTTNDILGVTFFTLGAGNAKLDLERVFHPISFRYQETFLEVVVGQRLVIALHKKCKTANTIELQGELMPRLLLKIQHINARNV
jgi:hypothetical protein